MSKTIFVCENCGEEFLMWSGRCENCGSWNTLKEISSKMTSRINEKRLSNVRPPEKLTDIKVEKFQRIKSSEQEFDRVLGGGLVLGSLVLLGGEPGIGKSTLLLQMAEKIAKSAKLFVLYVSGEESGQQLKMRAGRLEIKGENIFFLSETNVDNIIASASNLTIQMVIIDSIQTMYDENFPSTPGSIVQVRESAMRLQNFAKEKNIPVILVGHVTKEGSVAGPKTLEHLVDVVLYLEGERFQNLRILHGVKNRFGATEEVGVFEMSQKGLLGVKNPSKIFLESHIGAPGSAVTSLLSGTRSFLLEIQTLISKSVFGYPKRVVSGFDLRRLDLLLAVMEKRMQIPFNLYDVYVNTIGGMKIDDRAADLAVCASLYSIFQNKKIIGKTVFLGEVGLSGEIRPVAQLSKRIKEARALGFNNIIGPEYKTIDNALKKAMEEI